MAHKAFIEPLFPNASAILMGAWTSTCDFVGKVSGELLKKPAAYVLKGILGTSRMVFSTLKHAISSIRDTTKQILNNSWPRFAGYKPEIDEYTPSVAEVLRHTEPNIAVQQAKLAPLRFVLGLQAGFVSFLNRVDTSVDQYEYAEKAYQRAQEEFDDNPLCTFGEFLFGSEVRDDALDSDRRNFLNATQKATQESVLKGLEVSSQDLGSLKSLFQGLHLDAEEIPLIEQTQNVLKKLHSELSLGHSFRDLTPKLQDEIAELSVDMMLNENPEIQKLADNFNESLGLSSESIRQKAATIPSASLQSPFTFYSPGQWMTFK